jgi:cell wall assembly regulator SMI1
MEEIWERIDAWLKVNASKVFETLQAGASDSQIQTIEDALSVKFPEDFRVSYRIHDGQLQSKSFWGLIPDAEDFLCLERLQGEWQKWKELLDSGDFNGYESAPDPGIKADWWNARWIPFTWDGDGNNYCLDLDPAKGGTVGQIITMIHDDSRRRIIAPSFYNWLEDYAAKLESGEYVFSEKHAAFPGIVRSELLERFKQMDLEEEKEKYSPPPHPIADTVVMSKSITIGVYDEWKQPISRDAPAEDKDEITISLNGEPILPNILIDSSEQFYTVELAPGMNEITVTLVREARAAIFFVTIDRNLLHAGKSEHGFGLSESWPSASFTISYLPD